MTDFAQLTPACHSARFTWVSVIGEARGVWRTLEETGTASYTLCQRSGWIMWVRFVEVLDRKVASHSTQNDDMYVGDTECVHPECFTFHSQIWPSQLHVTESVKCLHFFRFFFLNFAKCEQSFNIALGHAVVFLVHEFFWFLFIFLNVQSERWRWPKPFAHRRSLVSLKPKNCIRKSVWNEALHERWGQAVLLVGCGKGISFRQQPDSWH